MKTRVGPVPINLSIPENATANSTPWLTVPDNFTAVFNFNPPIKIEPDSYNDLILLSIPYSIPNIVGPGILPSISNGNNRYSINWNGVGFVDYYLPQGLYSYFDIAYQLNAQAVINGWIYAGQELFTVVGVSATQTLTITVNPAVLPGMIFPVGSVVISFVNPSPVTGINDSVGNILGYGTTSPDAVLTCPGSGNVPASFPAPHVADFARVTSYLIYVSTCVDSYSNGQTGQLLFSLPLGPFEPNSDASYQASMRYPVPAQFGTHSQIRVYFTDNSGGKIPLNLFQGNININYVISKNKSDGSF
jgi:hypothetical protein